MAKTENANNVASALKDGPIVESRTTKRRVKYSAYNFRTKKFNCVKYLGQKVYRDIEELEGAKEVFEKENPKWELVEIRSMCTEESMANYGHAYNKMPAASDKGENHALGLVVFDKELDKMLEVWVFRNDGTRTDVYAQSGLHICSLHMRHKNDLRAQVVAALESVKARAR